MLKEFSMPKLGHVMEDGFISEWLITIGERVKKGDIIVKVETGKSIVEVEAPFDGVLKRIVAGEGETALVGQLIAEFE